MDFTTNWLWPQWTMAILLFVGFLITASKHGQERLETSGERKGKPERYSGFMAIARAVLWVSILVCGGFFR